MRCVLAFSLLCWSLSSASAWTLNLIATNTCVPCSGADGTPVQFRIRNNTSGANNTVSYVASCNPSSEPWTSIPANAGDSIQVEAQRYINSTWLPAQVIDSFAAPDSHAYYRYSGCYGAIPPVVTNTLHSVCITNRTPLPRAVLVQVGSGSSWEVVSSQNLIVLASGQEWCASYVIDGPPDGTAVCAVLVDPGSLSSPFIATWGRVCGSQSTTTNAATSGVITGTIVSPPLSNRLASVYGTNVSSLLSSTGALTGQSLGALLAGMTDLTGGASGSASGVTGGGNWTNAGVAGGVSNGVAWNGSNIVSAVGHLENSLTNRQVDWGQTNNYSLQAAGMDSAGQSAGSGVASTLSNGFSGFGAGLTALRDAYPAEAVTPVETQLGLLSTSASVPAIIRNKVEFDPWKYPGVRRIADLIRKFLIWFGVLVVIQYMMNRTAFLCREFGKQGEGSSSTWIVGAPGGVGMITGTPAGMVKAGIWVVALGGLAIACTAGIGHWFADWQQPISEAIADGTAFGTGAAGGTVGDIWRTALVWSHRVVPWVTWLAFAIEYAAWWLLTNGVFTMISTGQKFARL